MPTKKSTTTPTPVTFTSSAKAEPNKKTPWLAILLFLLAILALGYVLVTWLTPSIVGATNACDAGKYCADWNHNRTVCEDWDYKICHINPSQAVQHDYNNYSSCTNHLGTPHNDQTYDVGGVCPPPPTVTLTPTQTPTQTPTPTPTTAPTPPPEVCEQTEWSCQDCQTLEDNVCYKDKENYCGEGYGCSWQECNGEFTLLDAVCESQWVCKDTCKIPDPPPTEPPPSISTQSAPSGCTQNCGVPACTDQTPQPVTNPHVYRNGDCAIVKYWPSSDKVNLYWKQNSSGDWQYSLANQPATGNHTICALGSMDVTFGVQSVSGCAADGVVNASTISQIVDGPTSAWTLFR